MKAGAAVTNTHNCIINQKEGRQWSFSSIALICRAHEVQVDAEEAQKFQANMSN